VLILLQPLEHPHVASLHCFPSLELRVAFALGVATVQCPLQNLYMSMAGSPSLHLSWFGFSMHILSQPLQHPHITALGCCVETTHDRMDTPFQLPTSTAQDGLPLLRLC